MAYTQQDRLRAYSIFLETGDMQEVTRRTNIASKTLYRWKKKEDWNELIKQFKIKVRAKLEERGISKFVVKDENLLGVGRILFQIAYNSIRATITDEEGNKIPNPSRILPGLIGDVITLLTKAMAIQTEVLGRTKREEPDLDITEEQRDAIYKILLGERAYNSDSAKIGRRKAEAFRNGKKTGEIAAKEKEYQQGKTNKEIWGTGDWEY